MGLETRKYEHFNQYELVYVKEKRKRPLIPRYLGLGRHIIGRISHCDFQIKSHKISAIHAVLEITDKGIYLFDMNSTNGLFLNGDKVIQSEVKEGDIISFAGLEYRLSKVKPKLPNDTPIVKQSIGQGHPLAQFTEIESTEYIFEDKEKVYPIFKYHIDQSSYEVLILHNDRVVSVDYINSDYNKVYFSGQETGNDNRIYCAFFKRKEKKLFLKKVKEKIYIQNIKGFSLEKLTQSHVESYDDFKEVEFGANDIVRISGDHLEIYLRKVKTPPAIIPAPIFRRDAFVHKYVIPTVLSLFIPLFILSFFTIEKNDKKEEQIERVATILYRKKKPLALKKKQSNSSLSQVRKESAPKKSLKKEERIKLKQEDSNTPQAIKKFVKTSKKEVKKSTKIVLKNKKRKKILRKAKAKIQGVKNIDFRSSLNQLLISQSRLVDSRKNKVIEKSLNEEGKGEFTLSHEGEKRLKRVGSGQGERLADGVRQDITQNIGAKGLSDKKSYYQFGQVGHSVVEGSIDRSDILRRLREHLSQFRSCVDKQLKPGETRGDRVTFQFSIGASGYVSRGNILSKVYGGQIKSCLKNVLRGIKFTPPQGGAANVEFDFNFHK